MFVGDECGLKRSTVALEALNYFEATFVAVGGSAVDASRCAVVEAMNFAVEAMNLAKMSVAVEAITPLNFQALHYRGFRHQDSHY